MRTILAVTIAGAFTFAISSAHAVPVSAPHKPGVTEFSSANKKQRQTKKKSHQSRHYNRAYRSYGADYGPVYRRPFAADPSFDPSGRPYRPNIYSPCTIDLGYGRFTSCDR